MPREQGSGEAAEGRDTGGLDDWQRIEAEQSKRDAIGRKWDATHDPSPEFENSAMPLGPDYGRDRPKHRDYTPEQQAELEATFGRPIEELLALRDQDPRAGHNRDEHGRILDTDGNPRQFTDPREHLLEEQAPPARAASEQGQAEPRRQDEAEAQSERTTPDTTEPTGQGDSPAEGRPGQPDKSTDLQAPSDETNERDDGEADQGDGNGDSGNDDLTASPADDEPPVPDRPVDLGATAYQPSEPEHPTDEKTELELPQDLGELVGQLATDLRDGKLTPQQAAEHLEEFLDRIEPAGSTPETTTEIVRETDGYRYEKDTPTELPEEVESQEENRWKELSRTFMRNAEEIHDKVDKGMDRGQVLLRPVEPTGSEQRQAAEPAYYDQSRQGVDAGDAATTVMVVAVLTIGAARAALQRANDPQRGKG